MAYIVYKDNSNYYVFAQQISSASEVNPNRIIQNQPSYVIEAIKEQVRLASTSNLDLSSTHTVVDGVSLTNADRVLLTAQSTASENGIYFWDAGHQTFFRTEDGSDLRAGLLVSVTDGSVEADSLWMLSTEDPVEVGVTALGFVRVTTSASHAPTHVYSGLDEVDGDQLGIDYVPTTYARNTTGGLVTDNKQLTSHLQGIDVALTGAAAHAWSHAPGSSDPLEVERLAFSKAIEDGVTITVGDALAASTVTGRITQANANADANSAFIGIALSGGTGDAGGTVSTLVSTAGLVTDSGAAFTAGSALYLPDGTGRPTHTAPVDIGDAVYLIGYAISSTEYVIQTGSVTIVT